MTQNRGEGNLEALVGSFIAGYLGYQAGSRKFAGWEPIIKNYETRMSHLAYNKAFRPVSFLATIPNAEIIYREAILAYLFGLPDASIPLSLRCLEIGLSNKYTRVTGQAPPTRDKLFKLIEWGEDYLKGEKGVAHGFRLLRNLIHGERVMVEQDALEAIRHISIILNLLYPPPNYTTVFYFCQNCGGQSKLDVLTQDCYLGNVLNTTCAHCSRPTPVLVI
jgi:hypothetical protein